VVLDGVGWCQLVLGGASWRHVVPGDARWYQVTGMTWVTIPRLDVMCRIVTRNAMGCMVFLLW